MRRSSSFRLALVMALGATPALAQTPAATPPAPAPAAPAATPPAPAPAAAPPAPAPAAAPAPSAAPVAPATPRPGPSPYSEAVQKGDGLLLARDFDGAIGAYKQEIDKNPTAGLGHYRLGEAQLAKGNVTEAEIAWQTALRFAGPDERLRSKILFVLADVKERQKANDEAVTRWKEYEQHARTVPDAKGHPATALERVKRADEWKKISADAAEVRARIKKRIDEADEALRKTSK